MSRTDLLTLRLDFFFLAKGQRIRDWGCSALSGTPISYSLLPRLLIISEDGEENLPEGVYEDKETVSSGHIRIAPPVSHNCWDSTHKSQGDQILAWRRKLDTKVPPEGLLAIDR